MVEYLTWDTYKPYKSKLLRGIVESLGSLEY